MEDDTIVCRCEEVTVEEIRKAIREGAVDLTGVKRRTRAGMGLCQGRTCEKIVTQILARELEKPVSAFKQATVQAPVQPITFSLLAKASHD
ncbi:(2Fe-2S)-binding protein [Candidatus Bipolaricaulota bacterium]|jgi:NAD(P)H-nitrite reductase large subunit|nr:(2Fe-2S)-binding protein [Candidatus Bipolaricaulota bacterium]